MTNRGSDAVYSKYSSVCTARELILHIFRRAAVLLIQPLSHCN
jgi:hypothetical protein